RQGCTGPRCPRTRSPGRGRRRRSTQDVRRAGEGPARERLVSPDPDRAGIAREPKGSLARSQPVDWSKVDDTRASGRAERWLPSRTTTVTTLSERPLVGVAVVMYVSTRYGL